MRKIRNYILYIALLFVPFLVFAADSSASNWRMYCDDINIVEGGSTKCYLLAQIDDATSGGKDITAVLSKITGSKIFVDGQEGGSAGISVTKTEYGAAFTGTLDHGAANCAGELGCYDFTAAAIKSNTTTAVSQETGNANFTPIGVWTVRLDEQYITADSDECGRICVDVDYIIGTTRANGVTHSVDNANGTCQELHLVGRKVCKIDNGKYYGKDGNEVTKEVYDAECNPKICKIENGKYYDKNGNEVTVEQFKQACACRIDNGKYYDDNGNEVAKEVYVQKCTCRIENGKYYDGTGTEVTKEVYEKNCTCRKTADGKYYGKDGSEITEEQYNKDCIPPTGSFASYAVLAAGALIALSAIMIAQKHNRFYRV